ncbi:Glycosyltransferase, GT2 family [Blastococcus sp. DSM 46786]|uniref:glycosyltransferase family 2 protein n=1 Tax=Blastococcus sp. DSM 46786 TaxID=1798227 RepID=UPI0008CB0148|nr:glycosyltransferase [Blastococcus sp. DSM 46786]SEL20491.1 Glycosyltransferase, GT2 family [Blastococcus sp. DSM 46786]
MTTYTPIRGLAVAVAVLTFRRPGDLEAVLPHLVRQAGELRSRECAVEVLVVDNDAGGSARQTVRPWASDGVRYVVEPVPGIAAARNRALAEAHGADLLVFIDDDERPHDGWLGLLLDTWRSTGAQAVAGAVVSELPGEMDAWAGAGDFLRRRRLRTGTPIDVAATNNLLLDLSFVRRHGLLFDERFGLSGGSDTLFTRRLVAEGGLLVWCDEAVVTDQVPADRLTREWVLRRAFRSGNTAVRVDVVLAAGPGARTVARARAAARGSARLAGGGVRWAMSSLARADHSAARGLRTAARGAGMLAAVAGMVYREYRRDPAPPGAARR